MDHSRVPPSTITMPNNLGGANISDSITRAAADLEGELVVANVVVAAAAAAAAAAAVIGMCGASAEAMPASEVVDDPTLR